MTSGIQVRPDRKLTYYERRMRWLRNDPRRRLYYSAYTNANANKYDFNLDLEDIILPERCPISDIPLFWTDGKRTPNTPTVDRIDNTKGYIKGNIMIVSWRINNIKKDLSLEELKRMYEYYCK